MESDCKLSVSSRSLDEMWGNLCCLAIDIDLMNNTYDCQDKFLFHNSYNSAKELCDELKKQLNDICSNSQSTLF